MIKFFDFESTLRNTFADRHQKCCIGMQKMNALACARVSRFSFFAFTASPVWRFSFTYRRLWVKVFAKKASPFVHRHRPFEGMHTHRTYGRRITGTRDRKTPNLRRIARSLLHSGG